MLPCVFFWMSILIVIILNILNQKLLAHTLLLLAGLCMFLFPDAIHKIFRDPLDDNVRKIYLVLGAMIVFSGVGFLVNDLAYVPKMLKILPGLILTLAGLLFFLLVIHVLTR
jgi:hypothetical protein